MKADILVRLVDEGLLRDDSRLRRRDCRLEQLRNGEVG